MLKAIYLKPSQHRNSRENIKGTPILILMTFPPLGLLIVDFVVNFKIL